MENFWRKEGKNNRCFHFSLSDAPRAGDIITSRFGIRDFTVENNCELWVRDMALDIGTAVRLFVEEGLAVTEAHLQEDTLEDYFKKITGGEGIA